MQKNTAFPKGKNLLRIFNIARNIAKLKEKKNESRVKAFYLLGFNKYLEEVGEASGRQENELFLTVVIRRVLQKLTMLWTHFFHHHLKRTVTEYLSLPCQLYLHYLLQFSNAEVKFSFKALKDRKMASPGSLGLSHFYKEISAPVTKQACSK